MAVSLTIKPETNPDFILFLELFQTLFNILYEENINCRLVKSALFDEKLLNWNRLNAQICFNYLQ